MHCPSCATEHLVNNQLETGLPSHACGQCSGVLLALPAYSDWLNRQEAESDTSVVPDDFDIEDSKRAVGCPNCQRIMVKYKVAVDAKHTLDFCFACGHVWLDPGEWDYLKSQGLHKRIRSISTDPWQRRIREESGAQTKAENFRQLLGHEAFSTVEQFRLWLAEHPKREEILRHLGVRR